MEVITGQLVFNSPSLQRLCVHRVRQSISCMGQNIGNSLIEKLSSGDFRDLKNLKVPMYLKDMCKYYYSKYGMVKFYLTNKQKYMVK